MQSSPEYSESLSERRARFRIGNAPVRLEDQKFVTGSGCFVGDLRLPAETTCIMLRSPHAHARIKSIDVEAAKAAPGVLAVLTGEDLKRDGLGGIPWEVRPPGERFAKVPMGSAEGAEPQPIIAQGAVRYVGEIVALVVAEQEWQALDASELIVVDYEDLPVLPDVLAAMEPGAPAIWPEFPDNRCFIVRMGDPDAVASALAEAAVRVSLTTRNRRVAGAPIEVRGYAGEYDPSSETYTLHGAVAKPHPIRQTLAQYVLKVPTGQVQVKVPDIGGGYGTKNVLYPEEGLVLWAARVVGRPVKWLGTRQESFLSDMAGRDHVDEGEMGFDSEGRIVAFRARCLANLGGYLAPRGVVPVRNSGNGMSGVYRMPALSYEGLGIFTNSAPTCSLRGSGQPEMMYLIERLLDRGARKLGIDPAEIRRRNVIPAAAMPYTTAHGITYDSGDPGGTLAAALGRMRVDLLDQRKAEARARGKLRGLGIANAIEVLNVFYDEPAWLEVASDGNILCLCGTQSSGQGHATAYAQIVAGRLGVPLPSVSVLQGDTRRIPSGNGTGASRSISSGGSAVALAVEELIVRGCELTAKLSGVAADEVAFRDGAWEIANTNRRLTLPDLAARCDAAGLIGEFKVTGTFKPKDGTYPYGTHACEVEVDPDTGAVAIVNYASTHDVGFAINPVLIDGQVHGSTIQGIGQALFEQAVYDEAGQLMTGSFMDYGLPRAGDIPQNFTASIIEIPCLNNPLGSKGVGESGTLGAPPAVINAILDALAPLGVDDVEMPATPFRVWQAIKAAKAKKGSP